MPHVRTQIRDAVVAALTPVVSPVEVFKSRIYQLPKATDAALLVYARSDEPDYDSGVAGKPRKLFRDLGITVEILKKATATFDDDVDALCVSVEKAIAADPTLSGLVLDTQTGLTTIDVDHDGETPVGYAALTFTATYRVAENDPENTV